MEVDLVLKTGTDSSMYSFSAQYCSRYFYRNPLPAVVLDVIRFERDRNPNDSYLFLFEGVLTNAVPNILSREHSPRFGTLIWGVFPQKFWGSHPFWSRSIFLLEIFPFKTYWNDQNKPSCREVICVL